MIPLWLACAAPPSAKPVEPSESATTAPAPTTDPSCDPAVWYVDADGDGVGSTESTEACERPDGHVPTAGDCDDADPTVHPGAIDACDERDDDCDGAVDEDEPPTAWYPDGDADGYGAPTDPVLACTPPDHTSSNADDCDDTRAASYPGAPDPCDGDDNDCDGAVDEDDRPGWWLITVDTTAVWRVDPDTAATTWIADLQVPGNIASTDVSDDGSSVGFDADTGSLVSLDACTGAVTPIGPAGSGEIGGIAFGAGGVLYALDYGDGDLVTVDPATGATAAVGSVGWDIGYDGLAWDCAADRLLGVEDGTDWLFTLDPASGRGHDFLPLDLSFEVVGLTWHAASGLLLVSTGPELFTLDPDSGLTTTRGTFDLPDVNDLAFHPPCAPE